MLDSSKGILRIYETDKPFRDSPAGFRVSYTGGYKVVDAKWAYLDVPTALATATAMQAAYFFNANSKGSLGLETVGGDDPQSSKAAVKGDKEALIPEARSALRPFVRQGSLLGRGM